MTDRKRLLGLDRSITRRDFVNVAGVGIAASAFMSCGSQDSISEGSLAADPWSDHLGPEWYGPGGVGDYELSHGNTPEVVQACLL